MAGLVGVVNHRRAPDPGDVRRMLDRLAHRGARTRGVYLGEVCALGVCQHLTDVADANEGDEPAIPTGPNRAGQPYAEGRKDVRVAFDGCLTNAADLRASLTARGARFQTGWDAEVVLEGYRRDGEAVFEGLRGPFACAVWDHSTQTCFLVRDLFGQRPLYWRSTGDELRFASEAKALTAHDGCSRLLDPFAVADYFAWGYVMAPRTIWQDVRSLPPGHLASWHHGRLRMRRIASLDWTPASARGTADDWTRELLARLERSMADAWRVDRPNSPAPLLLDGDPASQLLALLSTRAWSDVGNAVTIGANVAPDPFGAGQAATASFAQALGLEHREIVVSLARRPSEAPATGRGPLVDAFDAVAAHLDQPLADPNLLVDFATLAALREQGIRSILAAGGAHEVFGGYKRHQSFVRADRLAWAPPMLREIGAWLARRLPQGASGGRDRIAGCAAPPAGSWPFAAMWSELRQFFAGFVLPPRERYLHWLQCVSPAVRNGLFTHEFARLIRGHDALRERRDAFDRLSGRRGLDEEAGRSSANGTTAVAHGLRRWPSDWELPGAAPGSIRYDGIPGERPGIDHALALDLATSLPGQLLARADAAGTLAGIDVRLPFLDRDLVSWAVQVPANLKVGSRDGMRVVRRALYNAAPSGPAGAPVDASKRGKQLAKWLLQPGRLDDVVRERLQSPACRQRGILEPRAIDRLLDAHRAGRYDGAAEILALFMFETWCQLH